MGGSREGVSICMHAPIWIHESKITFTSRSIEPLLARQFTGHELGQTLGDGEGQRSQVCYSPWGLEKLDATW